MKRREFLSATGVILGGLGLSQSRLLGWQRALADTNRSKRALLIGINAYPSKVLDPGQLPLHGCLNDVELQRQLLVHRFGFAPNNIVTLVDAQATQRAILEALYQLATTSGANDCVVIHFSGYGAQLMLGETPIKTWLPVDGYLPTADNPVARDVPVPWVKKILAKLKTKQVFTVVDAGYSQPPGLLSSGYYCRSRLSVPTVEAIDGPQLSTDGTLDFKQLRTAPEPTFFPGDLLLAASDGQPVIERQWNNFGAGLFTYALTHYLWSAQLPAGLSAAMRSAQELILPLAPNQTPYWTSQTAGGHTIYGDTSVPSLDAVITAVDERSANLWLGGLPADVVQYGEQFGLAPEPDRDVPTVVTRSQTGLTGRLKLSDESWTVGQPLYEVTRVLPKALPLMVSIDSDLARIERVDATSALASLAFVESTDDSRPADCMLGKVPSQESTDGETPKGTNGKQIYGLFTPTRDLIVGSLAKQDEAVKIAVNRLTPKLKTILAMKWLRLSENQSSSHLAVRLNLLLAGETDKLVLQRQTRRASEQVAKKRLADAVNRQNYPVEFSKGSQIRYQALNFGDSAVYTLLLSFDAHDRMTAFLPSTDGQPYTLETLQTALTLDPGTATMMPRQTTWVVDDSEGRVETYLICSRRPLMACWQELLSLANTVSNQRVPLGEQALPLVQALLDDLNDPAVAENDVDSYTLNAARWATVGCHYNLV